MGPGRGLAPPQNIVINFNIILYLTVMVQEHTGAPGALPSVIKSILDFVIYLFKTI